MPIYCFKCPACGQTRQISLSMSRRGELQLCENDGFAMNRDIRAEAAGFNHKAGNWPMESDAAGVAVDQVDQAAREMARQGCPTDFNPDTGAAIFTGPAHRKKACEIIGLHDRNAGYSDPTPADK